MAKGQNQKKTSKKKPLKTLKEKSKLNEKRKIRVMKRSSNCNSIRSLIFRSTLVSTRLPRS